MKYNNHYHKHKASQWRGPEYSIEREGGELKSLGNHKEN